MDPVFGFIFDEGTNGLQELQLFDKDHQGLYLEANKHPPITHVPSAKALLDEQSLDYVKPEVDQETVASISPEIRSILAGLIQEYLADSISLRPFLQKVHILFFLRKKYMFISVQR
jgi:hypothetical protein